jgi:Spo0E like sporulation regulatory protein
VGQERMEELEAMLERLRGELYKLVDGNPAHLSDARVLPLSCQMDALIVQIQRAKRSQSNRENFGDMMKT